MLILALAFPGLAATAQTWKVGSEAAILAYSAPALAVFRFAPNPAVLVLDFPSLAEQGAMLNRLAALAEKRGLPHDRLLDDAALAAAVARSGQTASTWYYGHDYRADDVLRLFDLADRQRLALTAQEQRLRALVAQARAGADGFGALISLTAPDAAHGIDAAARGAILHHELSHGDYFTQAPYAAYVRQFWSEVLTAPERAAVRSYLAAEGYDPGIEDLMANEMQAYLMFTPDRRYFDPNRLGIAPARLAALRRHFAADLPAAARPLGLSVRSGDDTGRRL